MAYLLADTREKHSGDNKRHSDPIDFIETKISENNKKYAFLPPKAGGGEIKYVMKKIDVGDYAIILPPAKRDQKNTLAVVFERKTWQDLAGSIKDDRISQQHKNLEGIREKTGCRVYYLIEGTPRSDEAKVGRIPFKNLLAKLLHNSLRGIHFIQTKNAENTAEYLVKIARSVIKMVTLGELKFGAAEHTFQSDLAALIARAPPDIAKKLAEIGRQIDGEKQEIALNKGEFPGELNEKPIKENVDIIAKMFMQLPGIGSTVANAIMQKYTLKDIICVPEDKKLELADAISSVKCTSGMSVGAVKAKKIVNCDFSADGAGPDILSQIQGVSIEIAKTILRAFSLDLIIEGKIDETDIASITHNDRKIGLKVANRIFATFNNS